MLNFFLDGDNQTNVLFLPMQAPIAVCELRVKCSTLTRVCANEFREETETEFETRATEPHKTNWQKRL